MATVLDITSKLKQENKVLRIGETDFQVDDSKNTVIAAMAVMENADADQMKSMDKALEMLLGADGFAELEQIHLNFQSYKKVFSAVIALASGTDFEEMEKRFQDGTEQ